MKPKFSIKDKIHFVYDGLNFEGEIVKLEDRYFTAHVKIEKATEIKWLSVAMPVKMSCATLNNHSKLIRAELNNFEITAKNKNLIHFKITKTK